MRGRAQDFDTWAQMGNRGWSYAEVLPFFKSMESYAGEGNDALRGREGPLRVTSRRGQPHAAFGVNRDLRAACGNTIRNSPRITRGRISRLSSSPLDFNP